MASRSLRRMLVLLIVLIGLGSTSLAQDTPSQIPYIYYYANTANALVVERADGTDSRFVGLGAMPDDHGVIADLDWSRSGKWMAWRSSTYNDPGALIYRSWIARADGSERLTLLDHFDHILTMQWSPVDDLLFTASRNAAGGLQLSIIDPAENKVIAHTAYEDDYQGLEFEGFPSGWLGDGSGIYFLSRYADRVLLNQLKLSNEFSSRIFTPLASDQSSLVNVTNGRVLSYETLREGSGKIQLRMQDLAGGKAVLIDSLSAETLRQKQQYVGATWNSNMQYALIFAWACKQTQSCAYPNSPRMQAYLLDWETGTLQFIAARITSRGDWSPDGRYALLVDELNHLIILDATTKTVFPSITLPGISRWQWTSRSDTLILFSALGRQLYRYDLKQQTLSSLDVSIHRYSTFSLSPDGRFAGIINRYSSDDSPDMFDLRTRGKLRWAHHSLGSSAGTILDYVWHPDSRWYMTGEWSALSGGPGPSSVTLLNTDGTVRRELSICGRVGYCAGFVPERALPHLGEGSSKSVIPEAQYSMLHDGRVIAVAWSPDGSKIASYNQTSETNLSGSLNIWDVRSTPRLLTSHQTELDIGYLVLGGSMTWDTDGALLRMANPSEFEQYVWDANTGAFLETRPIDAETANTALPDNSTVIVDASYSHRIRVWDAATSKQLPDLNWYARSAALSPDGTRLAAAGTSLVTIWDVADLKPEGE